MASDYENEYDGSDVTADEEEHDFLRERELYKYYQPSSPAPSSGEDETSHYPIHTQSKDPVPTSGALSMNDAVLGSIVLLTAKLMETQRAVILLADQYQEYLVSDSDRTTAWFTHSELPLSAKDELPRTEKRPHKRGGMFHSTYARRKPFEPGKKNQDTAKMLEIRDVKEDGRLQNDPWLEDWDTVQYYAGIPIRTLNGVMIGLLCVLDSAPRPDGMGEHGQKTLIKMGDAVVQYLSLVRKERDMQKSRRMELALSRFIASNFSPDRVDLGLHNDGNLKLENASQESERIEQTRQSAGKERERKRKKKKKYRKQGIRIDIPPPPAPNQAKEDHNYQSSGPSSPETMDEDQPPFQQPPNDPKTLRVETGRNSPSSYYGLPFPEQRNSSESPRSSAEHSPYFPDDAPAPVFDTTFLAHPTQDTLFLPPSEDEPSPPPVEKTSNAASVSGARNLPSPGVDASHRKLFTRAAALMHHAIQADGVVFLKPDLEGVSDLNSPWGKNTPGLVSSNAKDSEDARSARPKNVRRLSGILGYSSNPIKQVGSDIVSENLDTVKALGFDTSQLDEPFVRHLTDSWPHGRIFTYSKHHRRTVISVPVRHHTSSPVEEEPVERLTRSTDVEQLRKFLPGSRQIVVVPLYDFIGNVFAVGFAWSSSKIRVFNGTVEGRFMSAFGNSIMAEVSRLHTISAEVAKSNFISSISHELRSPLHGIMASSELLIETSLDLFQRGLVGTIQNCGRTLLDTVNHILMFSRLNTGDRKTTTGILAEGARTYVTNSQENTFEEEIDIAQLVEEVVEAVHAGYEFRPKQKRSTSKLMSEYGKENKEGVIVVMDIDNLPGGWRFMSPPGALRTLLLNLCGNAICFTDGGWVKIQLSRKKAKGPNGEEIDVMMLTVFDSGRGMGKEYLKSSLFTPFSQEQPMNKGVGLGMSICRQIVDELNGTIEVRSQKDSGTRVAVRLPLRHIVHSDTDREENNMDELFKARKILAGKRICMAGFEPEYCKGLKPKLVDGLLVLHNSVTKALSELLDMHVVAKPFQEVTHEDVDLTMILNGPGLEEHVGRLGVKQDIPVIGLCRNVSTEGVPPTKPQVENVHLDFLPEPYGPRKLARAILDIFKNLEEEKGKKEQMEATAEKLVDGEPTKAIAAPDEEEIEKYKNLAVGDRQDCTDEQPERKEDTLDSESKPPAAPIKSEKPSVEQLKRTEIPIRPTIEIPLEACQKPLPESTPSTPAIRQDRPPSPELAPPAAPPPRSTPLSVLIVEDNHVNMMLLVTFAKKHGFEYERALNGLEALRMVENRAQGFDAILMDIQMPIMSGTESTRAIRLLEQERKLNAPSRALIIALTGLSADADRLEAARAGVDLYMVKPIALQKLERILRDRIRQRDGEEKGQLKINA